MSTDYVPENAENALRQWGQVIRAHDAVHPDRGVCGGVGACLLMRTELDAERDAVEFLEMLARRAASYTLTVKP